MVAALKAKVFALIFTALMLTSIAIPAVTVKAEESGAPRKLRALRQAISCILYRAEVLAEELNVEEVEQAIDELKQELSTLDSLIAEGNYEEAWTLAIELLRETRQLLRQLYGCECVQEVLDELSEEMIQQGVKARGLAMASILITVAEASNATEITQILAQAQELFEEGNVTSAKSLMAQCMLQLKRKAMVHTALRALNFTGCELKAAANATNGLEVAAVKIETAIDRLESVVEHLQSVNASETAITSVEEAIEHLENVKERLEERLEEGVGPHGSHGPQGAGDLLNEAQCAIEEAQHRFGHGQGSNQGSGHGQSSGQCQGPGHVHHPHGQPEINKPCGAHH